jgi:hypothetical protein
VLGALGLLTKISTKTIFPNPHASLDCGFSNPVERTTLEKGALLQNRKALSF